MDVSATLRTLGAGGTLSYAASRLAAHLPGIGYHRYRLIAQPVDGLPPMPRGFEAVALSPDAVAAEAHVLELPAAAIAHRSRQGMRCVAVARGGRIAGINWLTADAFVEDEVAVRFVPPRGAAWDTGLYIRREDRGGRAFAALWAASAAWLREHGCGWSMSRITDHNLGSWHAHQRMGARAVGTMTALRVGRHQWASTARPSHVRTDGPPAELRLPSPA